MKIVTLTNPNLVIRADADGQIGAGHIMRCLALAQAWQGVGGAVHFVCAGLPEPLHERIIAAGCCLQRTSQSPGSIEDADFVSEFARTTNADWIVADGYLFGLEFQRRVMQSSRRLLLIRDDAQATECRATAIVNPNLFARREDYPANPESEPMLGPEFALLREEFRRLARQPASAAGQVKNVLITFGGADPANMTVRALAAIQRLNDPALIVHIVVGGCAGPQPPPGENGTSQVHWHQNVGDMSRLMAHADLAITAGGATCLELAACSVPMLIVAVAENQIPVGQSFAQWSAGVYLGWHEQLNGDALTQKISELVRDYPARRSMVETAKRLVDGRGATRIVQRMLQPLVPLRPARLDDAQTLYDWQQDDGVRRWSFSHGPATWSEHCRWLAEKLANPASEIWICEDVAGESIGSVRFERTSGRATIGLVLDPAFRGRGLAAVLLRAALERYAKTNPGVEIEAFIKPDNEASRRAFAAAGFTLRGESMVHGVRAECWRFHPCATSHATSVLPAASDPIIPSQFSTANQH